MALWCNWLTRRPLKAKSPGSSPGNATKFPIKSVVWAQAARAIHPSSLCGGTLVALLSSIHSARIEWCRQRSASVQGSQSRQRPRAQAQGPSLTRTGAGSSCGHLFCCRDLEGRALHRSIFAGDVSLALIGVRLKRDRELHRTGLKLRSHLAIANGYAGLKESCGDERSFYLIGSDSAGTITSAICV